MADAQRRASHINSIIRHRDYVANDGLRAAELEHVEARLHRIEEVWRGFEAEHMAIIEATVPQDRDAIRLNETVMTSTEDSYLLIKAAYCRKINELRANQARQAAAAVPADGDNNNGAAAAAIPARNGTGMQLQPQDIPYFDGDETNWLEFRDLFIPMVHEDRNLVGTAKFNILKRHLRGPPLDDMAGMAAGNANYEIAWAMLRENYDNPRRITQALLKMIRRLKPLTTENPVGLRYIVIKFRQVRRQLASNGINVTEMSASLQFDLSELLDPATKIAMEAKQLKRAQNNLDPMTLDELLNWLETRARSAIQTPPESQRRRANERPPMFNRPNVNQATVSENLCPMCKKEHILEECDRFQSLAPFVRSKRVKSFRVCLNCLSSDHFVQTCTKGPCEYCPEKRMHHRLLCFVYCDSHPVQKPTVGHLGTFSSLAENASDRQLMRLHEHNIEALHTNGSPADVLLATTLIKVRTVAGDMITARALCDNGSQANIISEDFLQKLRLQRSVSLTEINPVGDGGGIRTRGIVQITVAAHWSNNADYCLEIHALIMGRVASVLPNTPAHIGEWPAKVMNNLADPSLQVPSRIDVLLGGHVWSKIIRSEIIRNPSNDLIAHSTQFGWLIYGGLTANVKPLIGEVCINSDANRQLNASLRQFFELEAVAEKRHRSYEEQLCENIFVNGVNRNADGRYIVPIPLDPKALPLGESRRTAYRRYLRMEERFKRDRDYRLKYTDFMDDYISQGHMTLLETPIEPDQPHYFIPHHGISSEKTGKFRVVFDASAVTSSGESLNDIQLLGERLQDNLADIILRFRVPRIALTADIKQMYRQILVDEAYRNYTLILWRPPGDQRIREYRLNTVTYGLKHSPHTAVRTLHKCADDGAAKHPLAASIVKSQFYMDDLSTGANTPREAIEIYHEIKALLSDGGFDLCKWTTNDAAVRKAIGDAASSNKPIEFISDDVHSVLGVVWRPPKDIIQFNITGPAAFKMLTKRVVTSEVAKLFDPTGLLAPYVIRGKILIRDLWLSKLNWDDAVTGELLRRWKAYYSTIQSLAKIRVPRWLGVRNHSKMDLHGFADASEAAYCAVIYYRIEQPDKSVRCGILASKTRVAPIKTVTIPRLELSGALLLARLSKNVQAALNGYVNTVTYWLDATIALCWIKQEPHALKIFVANRVSEIQTSTRGCAWRHVRSIENPADLGSRGTDAPELVENSLWWNGPTWLQLSSDQWPDSVVTMSKNEQLTFEGERKPPIVAAIAIDDFWIANRYSDFNKLCLVTAYILRFVTNVRFAVSKRKRGMPAARKLLPVNEIPPLARREWMRGETFWLRKIQQGAFAAEFGILSCSSGRIALPKRSRLTGLSPFMDEDGLLRVGGRLTNAPIPYNQRHPVILPGDVHLVRNLIRHRHLQLYHGGIQTTTQLLRDRFWIIGGRNAIRAVIHRCIECFRQRGQSASQQMVPLVPSRVTTSRPFSHISLDYCGPFEVKRSPGRCKTLVKIYVAVFICMATRAIHLQVVEDLTTAAFIDAYLQMAARRGHSTSITSDNAKCFIGAKRKFDEVLKIFRESSVHRTFATRGIEWHFIMPRSPAQGGSHEAAVKLFKHHLKRCVQESTLSVTEFSSLVTRIEGCINSRPLCALREAASDELILTPAHFLIHGPSENVAVEEPLDENMSLSTRWRRLQMLHQHFWRRWRLDYINSLANRKKWKEPQNNIAIGDIVLMTVDNVPPNQWPMGKVIEVHPGADGLVRNVTIKYLDKTFQRAVQRICRLPLEDQNNPVVCRQDGAAPV